MIVAHPDKNTVAPIKNIKFLIVLVIVIYQSFLVLSRYDHYTTDQIEEEKCHAKTLQNMLLMI